MTLADNISLISRYQRDGFSSPVQLITRQDASTHRKSLEDAEARFGDLHYKTKVHTILRSPLILATLPGVLDTVEQMIGPDILLYNVTYIIKEAGTKSHVSWHQDLTYWGLSDDAQVSMWLALSPATKQSGCMRMIPGSHTNGHIEHQLSDDANNVLFRGQTVPGIDENNAVTCPLEPGQASFHHGWTLHASMPNQSRDRRIGLNIQYLATHVRQTKYESDSAMLVHGVDNYNHFEVDTPAVSDLDADAVARQQWLEDRYKNIAATG